MPQASVGDNVEFECSNGGVLTILGGEGTTDLSTFGAGDMYAYYDDLHINAYNDMTIDMAGDYHVEGTVQHVTGDEVMRFNLSSREPNGKIDIKLSGLKSGSWYRLRFGGMLASCAGGVAHGRTNKDGLLTFNEVEIPNE